MVRCIQIIGLISPGAGIIGVDFIELDVLVQVTANEINSVTDLDGFGKLAIGLEIPRFIGRIFLDHISFSILIISETNKNDIRLIDPHFLSQISTNVTQSFDTVKTHSFESSITKHLGDLGVLLAIFFENEFTLEALIFILSSTPIFSSFSLILRHL